MSKAIRIHETGGPEVLTWDDVDVAEPGPGEVRLKQTAVGLNYIDVYHRTGLYPLPEYPACIGSEGAGVIAALGKGVVGLEVGMRVAYAGVPVGSYAEERNYPADRLVPLPDALTDAEAAALMLQGMTAEYLIRRTYSVKRGDIILIQAAAGGVGLILCQWAKALGATVIGTVGSDEKADLVREHGCDYPVVYTRESFKEKVTEVTDGQGVPVVYDSVGKDTWDDSLDCLRPRGLMVSFGNASGPVTSFAPGILAAKGSLFLTRPTLVNYIATREDLMESAGAVFAMVSKDLIKVSVNQTYPLKDAAQAHKDLEARKTTGSTVLIP